MMRAAVAVLVLSLMAPNAARAQSPPPDSAPTKGKASKPAKAPKPILPPVLKPVDSEAPARVDAAMLDRAYHRAQATRNIGIGLAGPGVALTILGAVVVGFGTRDPNLFDQGSEIFAGAITAAAGFAIGIPGVYFWSTGQDDMDSVVWRRRQLSGLPP
jgi:hypothetical protein